MYALLFLALLCLYAAIAWRDLRLGLAVLAGSLPAYLLRADVLGVPVTLLEAMMLIAIAIALIKHRKELVERLPRKWLPPLGLLLVAAIIGTAVSPDTRAALGVLKAYFIEPAAVFLVFAALMRRPEDKRRAVAALGISGMIIGLLALAQAATGLGLPSPWDLERRATGPYPFPNAVGLYLGPIVVLSSFAVYREALEKNWRHLVLWGAALVMMAAGMAAAQSEAAIAAAIAVLLACAIANKRLRRPAIAVAIVGAVAILASPLRGPVIEKAALRDYSGTIRREQWAETMPVLKDSPLLGAGLSGYPIAVRPFHARPEIEIFQYPHNLFLNALVEVGILGLAAFGWLIALATKATRSAWKGASKQRWVALAAGAAIAEMMAHGLVDVPYFKNDLSMLFWILLALLLIPHASKRPPQAKGR